MACNIGWGKQYVYAETSVCQSSLLLSTAAAAMSSASQVVEAQAINGGVQTCSAAAAVDLLWGLAVAGALLLELWDALAVALDKPDVGLTQQQLQKVGVAYVISTGMHHLSTR